MVGPIPGAGQKKKNLVSKHINITQEAAEVLDKLKFGEAGKFVSEAILLYSGENMSINEIRERLSYLKENDPKNITQIKLLSDKLKELDAKYSSILFRSGGRIK